VPYSTQLGQAQMATSAPECKTGVLVVRRHHLLVRCSHWLNVPILLGLILSGASKWMTGIPEAMFPGHGSTLSELEGRGPKGGLRGELGGHIRCHALAFDLLTCCASAKAFAASLTSSDGCQSLS